VTPLTDAVRDALGTPVVTATRLAGGDVAESYRMQLADGRTVFAKTHARPPAGFFTTEAWGLAWLAEPAVVAIPAVLAVSDGDDDRDDHDVGAPAFLALEWIDESTEIAPDDAAFGRSLAALHVAGAPCFGREDRRTTGSRALPNDPCDTWVDFYATRRLLPLARLATDAAALPSRAVRTLESVADRLSELGGAPEPPARLHGDLWAGNRIVDLTGRSWLVDPAAHGGHREFDLAMMRLFGGFAPAAERAYADVHPLADGWPARVALHQLAPLVVHAIKFAGAYVGATERALAAYA
jgi:fructosamine-3-kinase